VADWVTVAVGKPSDYSIMAQFSVQAKAVGQSGTHGIRQLSSSSVAPATGAEIHLIRREPVGYSNGGEYSSLHQNPPHFAAHLENTDGLAQHFLRFQSHRYRSRAAGVFLDA
jgi:hypothetical protein